jgi:hypothetical protein
LRYHCAQCSPGKKPEPHRARPQGPVSTPLATTTADERGEIARHVARGR